MFCHSFGDFDKDLRRFFVVIRLEAYHMLYLSCVGVCVCS